MVGFDKEKIAQRINQLRKDKLITHDDRKQMLALLEDAEKSRDAWEELSDAVRKHVVLRWNTQELLSGKKELQGSEVLTLADALAQKTLVKIDVWAKVNGRFMEVERLISKQAKELGLENPASFLV